MAAPRVISESQRQQIIEQYFNSGVTQEQLAYAFSCSTKTIWTIIARAKLERAESLSR